MLLTAFAGVRARVYGDRYGAVAFGLSALPLLLVAGSGIIGPDAGQGPGRLQFLLGCATVLVASVVLVALAPSGDAPFVAATFLAVVGTLATFAAILTDASATATASVCAPVAVGLVAFLPGLSARFARLPIGYAAPRTPSMDFDADEQPEVQPLEAERIALQARRGHEMLLGLVGGCAAVVVASAAVLGFAGNVWGQWLALSAGLAMLLRARLFRYTSQVACTLVAGLAAICLLILGLSLNPPADLLRELLVHGDRGGLNVRAIWLTAAVALGVALITAVGLIIPRKGLSPFWGRLLDIVEGAVLLSLVPLCLAVLDVYSAARSLTS